VSFEARYHGRCADCGEHIEPGDRVRYDGGVLVHDDCDDTITVEDDAPLDVCPTCWLIRPCECEVA
jgi:hypothetical protein